MDHTISALTGCEIASASHANLIEILDRYAGLAKAMWRAVLIDAAVSREWTVNNGRRNAYTRTAHLFCEAFQRATASGLAKDGAMDWPLTQADMADALGLSAVHVNRTLQQLRSANLIALSRGRLRLCDFEKLREIADFDGGYLQFDPAAEPPLQQAL